MNVTLDPEVQKLIESWITTGKYGSPAEVLTAAVYSLQKQQQEDDFEAGELDALIEEGEQSGAPLDGDAVLKSLKSV